MTKQMMLREVHYSGGGHFVHGCLIIYTCLLFVFVLYGTFCMSSSNCQYLQIFILCIAKIHCIVQ